MIYLHEPIIVKPGTVDDYVEAVGKYCYPGWSRYVSVTGAFKNAFHYNGAIFVWEYIAGVEGIDACGAYALADCDGMAWQRLAEKYRDNWSSQWVEGVSFSPTAAGHADSNEVIEIWTAGNSNTEYGATREAAMKDPDLKKWETEVESWRSQVLFRMLYGVIEFSPLRGRDEFLEAMDLMRAG